MAVVLVFAEDVLGLIICKVEEVWNLSVFL